MVEPLSFLRDHIDKIKAYQQNGWYEWVGLLVCFLFAFFFIHFAYLSREKKKKFTYFICLLGLFISLFCLAPLFAKYGLIYSYSPELYGILRLWENDLGNLDFFMENKLEKLLFPLWWIKVFYFFIVLMYFFVIFYIPWHNRKGNDSFSFITFSSFFLFGYVYAAYFVAPALIDFMKIIK